MWDKVGHRRDKVAKASTALWKLMDGEDDDDMGEEVSAREVSYFLPLLNFVLLLCILLSSPFLCSRPFQLESCTMVST